MTLRKSSQTAWNAMLNAKDLNGTVVAQGIEGGRART